jgi:hypothetical protein
MYNTSLLGCFYFYFLIAYHLDVVEPVLFVVVPVALVALVALLPPGGGADVLLIELEFPSVA